MRVNVLILLVLPAILPSVANSAASEPSGPASFMGLGDLPGGSFGSTAIDVSADGSVIVGFGTSTSDEAARWENGVTTGLGFLDLPGIKHSWAFGVSDDGSVIVGEATASESSSEAFLWTAATGMTSLGRIPGGISASAQAVSADGRVVVGRGLFADGSWGAFRWEDGVMTRLTDASGEPMLAQAEDVSADGWVIVGLSTNPIEAVLWESGAIRNLGFLPGTTHSVATAVSADGSVVVGWSGTASGIEAFRWANGQMTGLGVWEGHQSSFAHAVSGNGSIIVGNGISQTGESEVFIWDQVSGIRSLQELLVNDYGLDLGGWRLDEVFGISADGHTIVGDGVNPGGEHEAWVAVIPLLLPGPCVDGVDNDGDGLSDFPSDPGCSSSSDSSERAPSLPCDDGMDNDGDGSRDFLADTNSDGISDSPGDPGCRNPSWSKEDPGCQDGLNNDFNAGIDFDGGESIWGVAVDQPDPQCVGKPWRNGEAGSCGLGFELVLLALLPRLHRKGRA